MENYKTKYEIALKKVYELYRDWPCVSGLIDVRKELEEIFPELKESEDERIRKNIIYHIQNCDDTIDEQTENEMLAWLEKQKPVEWSEKDKHHIEVIENTLKKVYFEEDNDPKLAAAFVWLNSLKPKQYQMPVPTLPEGGEK